MAAGLLALSSRQFATTIIIKKTIFNHGPLSASHSNLMYFSFLSERSGRRMPPAERSALQYILVVVLDRVASRVIGLEV